MMYPFASLWIDGRTVLIADIVANALSPANPFEQHTFDFVRRWLQGDTVFTLHTSGSTGTPKPITITRAQMITSARMTATALGLKTGMPALVALDTRYIAGQMMLVRCLEVGMPMYLTAPAANPYALLPPDLTIDFTALVPYQIQQVLNSPQRERLAHTGVVIIGGAPLDIATRDQLKTLPVRSYATYGMTETLSHIALQPLFSDDDAFTLLPDVEVQQDAHGCLVIHAPHLPEPVVTHDLVELIGPRQFRWLGRRDNIINSGGLKINPEKIEAAIAHTLREWPAIPRYFVGPLPDDQLGQKAVLVIEGTRWPEHTLKTFEASLAGRLEKREFPRNIFFVDTFELTPTGKIHRQKTLQKVT